MRIFGKDWTATKISESTFELKCGKEKVSVCRSPADDGSWFPVGKGSWLALTFRVENNTLVLGRPKK